jgi:uncharacterized membrane protein YfcA
MDLSVLLLLFAAGCLAGFLAGFFGVGGGIVLVPVLLAIFSAFLGISGLVAMHFALGTSLLIVFFTSLSSAFQHFRNGQVDPVAALIIGAASVVVALGGAAVAAALPGKTLQRIFAGVLVLVAVMLLVEPRKKESAGTNGRSTGGLIITGIVSGAVSSRAGVGGGVFSVPLMYYALKFPLKRAIGTSSAAIVLTSLAATVGYAINGLGDPDTGPYPFTLGYVDYVHAFPVIVGTLPMARLGANVVHKTGSQRLRGLFAVLLLAVAIRMLFS